MRENQIITEAFTELAPKDQLTMDQELRQFWGISYMDFVSLMLKAASIKPGERVLDIATGTAVIPREIQKLSSHMPPIVGLDITPAMLNEGRKAIAISSPRPAIHLVCASAMCMPFADKSFQVVICGLGTHHMDVPQMLFEAKRLLADGGRLVISDVCATPFWRTILGKASLLMVLQYYGISNSAARAKAEIGAYKNVRTTQEWAETLKNFGFGELKMNVVQPRLPWFPGGLTIAAENLA